VKPLLRAGVVLGVALACLAPILALIAEALRATDGPAWTRLARGLAGERELRLFLRSLGVAGGASVLALGLGTLLGWALARLSGWRAALLEALACLVLLLPPIVFALGWSFALGRAGLLARLGLALPFPLASAPGAAFVLGLWTTPCVALLAVHGFRALDPSARKAARLVAGHSWRRARLELGALAPWLASGALLAFLLAFADYGVPSALTVNVYPVEIFSRLSAALDLSAALVSALPALFVAGLVFLARELVARRTLPPAVEAPVGRHAQLSAFALAFGVELLLLAAPLAALLVTARGAYAEALRIAGAQVWTSLVVASLATLFALCLALPLAWTYRGLARRGRTLAEATVLFPLLVPGAFVGLGLLALVTRGVQPFAALYPHAAILAYAGAVRALALPALVLCLSAASLRPALLHAAAVHGASPARAALGISLPLCAPALATAAALAFVSGLGELSAAVLVSPPGTMTLPVRIASLLHFGKDSIVAALCVMLCGLVLAVLSLGFLLSGRPLGLSPARAHRAP
jgi:iron(III) transport system permease protein